MTVAAKGQTFDDFKAQFGDDERAFAYLRIQVSYGFKVVFLGVEVWVIWGFVF